MLGMTVHVVTSASARCRGKAWSNVRRMLHRGTGQEASLGFEDHDRGTFIVDSANAYTESKISKRAFLRRMGLAGIGFSAFGLAMLGGHRRGQRGFGLAEPAYAQALPDSQARWLKEVGGKYRSAKIRYTSEATPPTVVLDQIKKE